ncbi:cell division protein FtsZ [Pseudoroseicyclus tamaricis]|uniref:Cell division protein FtsZ n=1 Tax=Pseudoroseicyclus tamaricis TaxID=2705421 RepID=A0A6B2JTL3_9RHOB|nr:cell division protein FtsZ [Pseudoroseicyclus tamaricis]NDV01390.1 cell division protein FtsZ [Pseudoroseicyclus tamaricis]
MTLNLSMPGQDDDLKPRITVFGVGGAGGNAVNNMIEKELDGVEFVVANTDAQALQQSRATAKIQMGIKATEGLGAGARPSVGASAAEESIEQILDHLAGAHMCFITAGMGGGTGTGAAPIIAQAARELGVLTVGVVTKPFQFEGSKRMRQAEEGVEALQKVVDTLIIIPNQNLFRIATEKTTFTEAFSMADDVLYQGVKGVTDLMVRPGLINLDFADVRAVMDEMGKAMMGTGEADGEDRAIIAAENAIANPLLDEISLEGAKGVLINITGGHDLTLFELDEAANKIREKVDPDANIIVGSTLDPSMEGAIRVSVVATGIDAVARTEEMPVPRRKMSAPLPQTAARAEEPEPQQPARRPAAAVAASEARRARTAEAEAPQARTQPQRAQPQPEPEVDEYHEPEPGLFDSAFDDSYEDEGAQMVDDDLPPPAYRPRSEAPVTRPAEDFVAPGRPPAGTPTPEAVARLRALTARRSGDAPAPARAAQPTPQQQPAAQGEGAHARRSGIGGLLGRMTGQPEGAAQQGNAQPQQAPRQQPAARQQPRVNSWDEDEADPEQERIEIPAFLRRQAN